MVVLRASAAGSAESDQERGANDHPRERGPPARRPGQRAGERIKP
jgi:hypothetical protein